MLHLSLRFQLDLFASSTSPLRNACPSLLISVPFYVTGRFGYDLSVICRNRPKQKFLFNLPYSGPRANSRGKMENEQISLPSLILVAILGLLIVRYLFFSSPATPAARQPQDAASASRAREAVVERVQQMFPQVDRRTILWDLQRNGGNIAATTERILAGRLETVSSFISMSSALLLRPAPACSLMNALCCVFTCIMTYHGYCVVLLTPTHRSPPLDSNHLLRHHL